MSKTMNKRKYIKFFRDFSLWSQERFERYLESLQEKGYSIISYRKKFNWFGFGDDVWEIVVER